MLIGYARISTEDQSLNLQKDALNESGCKKIFSDIASGVSERKGLNELLEYIRSGDTVVVWKLDRLGRSLKNLIELIGLLKEKNVGFKSLKENIDTTTPTGELILNIFGALAQFEREIIRERTKAGLAAARARGRLGGRRRILSDTGIEQAKKMIQDHSLDLNEICKMLKISRSILYRYTRK